jgi:iron(III) transport system ATP-binding protein
MASILKVENISCRYESQGAVDRATFELEEGTLACLLGPSGCGKTTVLRAIAGFQQLLTGSIVLNDNCISRPDYYLPPEHRNLSMVFQDHALFPHLTVEKNIAAGLIGVGKSEIDETVERMLSYVRLLGFRKRYPHELSGGQQQRVALARALAPSPRLLLMDEPFSSLDLELRESLGQEVRDLLKKIGTTCVMVTHNQQDAFTFSDYVGVMNEGKIEQWETPYYLYHEPQTKFVANFVGDGVFLDATILDHNHIQSELAVLEGDLGGETTRGKPVQLLVRPDDIIHDDDSNLTAKIRKKAFRGESYLYTLVLPSGSEILSLVPSHHNHAIGDDLGIKLEIDHLVFFDK